MRIKLRFLGAAQNVTGSRYLLETNDTRLLIDCGLYQERDFKARNWDPFPVPPRSIDAILLTHAHLDHCGFIPKLALDGFQGKIYCTSATADIAKIVLEDSGKIQEEDARHKKRRHEREGRKGPYPVKPLYTASDAKQCFDFFSRVNYEEPVDVGPGLTASYHDAGHILGASHIKLTVSENGEKRTIIFSGDIGRWDKVILNDPTIFTEADYVLMESTYGDRLHEQKKDINDSLCDIIKSTNNKGGNVIIPSFAIERSQELLYYLNELLRDECIPHLLVFLDSPMAIRVTEVFGRHPELFDEEMMDLIQKRESPFDFPGLKTARSVAHSKSINNIKGTVIIIAGSGMCTGGRIKHHLVNNIGKKSSTVLFVGYQAKGTLGRLILNGEHDVRILGKKYTVNARVARIQGFSAHADKNELTKWISGLQTPPRHLFITHGEEDVAHKFADYLRGKTDWNISVPNYLKEVVLE